MVVAVHEQLGQLTTWEFRFFAAKVCTLLPENVRVTGITENMSEFGVFVPSIILYRRFFFLILWFVCPDLGSELSGRGKRPISSRAPGNCHPQNGPMMPRLGFSQPS